MCHLWTDGTVEELCQFAEKIGLPRRYLQKPPKASWVHFDVNLTTKKKALAAGAILTDRFAALEHVARLTGDQGKLALVAKARALRQSNPSG